jgi:histidinol phosphatase-like PHP family hydrolase
MRIINLNDNDYHCHSTEFSDGFDTSITELIKIAGQNGASEIAITDHSQIALDISFKNKSPHKRSMINRWKNIFNDVNVIFGIEADLLNANGDICDYVQNDKKIIKPEFLILSGHKSTYQDDPQTINQAYRNAIERHHEKIKFLGHPCIKKIEKYLDIDALIEVANHYEIPLEFNCANLINKLTNLDSLDKVLEKADRIYVNSDAHTLWEFRDARKIGFEYLKEKGIELRSDYS